MPTHRPSSLDCRRQCAVLYIWKRTDRGILISGGEAVAQKEKAHVFGEPLSKGRIKGGEKSWIGAGEVEDVRG